jgi:hypothetical protein
MHLGINSILYLYVGTSTGNDTIPTYRTQRGLVGGYRQSSGDFIHSHVGGIRVSLNFEFCMRLIL